MSRKDLINLEFFPKLFPFEYSGFWYLDYDARMDLIDEGDTPFPDPVHIRKLALDTYTKNKI